MPAWLAPAIGLGSTIVGGLMNKSAADKGYSYQTEMNAKRIQTLAADAKEAGIHPLAALGAGAPNYQPVNDSTGDAVAAGGANVARSVQNVSAQKVAKQVASSEVDLNQANAELARTQSRTMIAQARSEAVGGPSRMQTDPTVGSTAPILGAPRRPGERPVAEDAENRYGGIISEAYGFKEWLADFLARSRQQRAEIEARIQNRWPVVPRPGPGIDHSDRSRWRTNR